VELFCLILLDYSVWKMYQTFFFYFFFNFTEWNFFIAPGDINKRLDMIVIVSYLRIKIRRLISNIYVAY
jgi:hypothetical protein